jgi:hypothetical protein
MRWLVTIVVIAIIAFLGYRFYYTGEGQQVAEQAEQAAEEATQAVEQAADEATEAVEGAADEAAETAEQATEAVEQGAETATESAERAADEAAGTAEQATQSAEQAAGAATESVEGAADEAAQSAEQMTRSAEETTAALTVGGVNFGEQIGTSVSDAVSALEGIKDKASAEAALPDLKAVDSKLGELSGSVEQLPQEGKAALATLLDDSLPELQDLVSKVEGIEGVGEVIKPTLDGIMTKLDAWAEQPA